MHSLLRIAATLAIASTLSHALGAQGLGPSVFDFNRDYHYGELGTIFPGPQSTSREEIFAGRGTLSLRQGLTFSVSEILTEVHPNGSIIVGPDNDGGIYHVDPDSTLTLDFNPTNPGLDFDELPINRSGSIVMLTREQADEESWIMFGVQVASGLDNTALTGAYRFVNQSMEYVTAGLTTSSQDGTITFDGAGNFRMAAREQTVLTNGTSSTTNVSSSGTYNVAADGTLTVLGTNLKGAVAKDSDVFFLVDMSGSSTEVGMSIGVRVGPTYTRDMVESSWAVHVHELELGAGAALPNAYTEYAFATLVGTGTMSGTYSGDGYGADSNPSGASGGTGMFNGTWTLRANGTLELLDSTGPPITSCALSANGEVAIASEQLGVTELVIFLKTCEGSDNYGTATAGKGGIEPEIGMRGFPSLGNSSFQLGIEEAVGGAPAAIWIAWQPSPVGIPFLGGQVWVNPLTILVSPGVAMSGSLGVAGAGTASVPLPIPSQASVVGLALFNQCLILDPAAPLGISMTGGFQLTICR